MATFEIKRTIFLTPNSRSEGVKSLAPLPNRVTLRKGERFQGQIVRSNQPNIESTLIFDYGGYHFEKPYGGTDVYANMNARDIVRFLPQGALVGSPSTRPMEVTENSANTGLPNSTENRPNSILAGETNPNNPTSSTTKSTSGMSMFQFKSKLHAGVTLVGVAFGVYYAYKTKASVGKYIGYALGAGAVGFILGSVASSFAMQTPVKQLKEQNTPTADLAKPNPMPPIAKVNTSVESGTMTNQMNLIL